MSPVTLIEADTAAAHARLATLAHEIWHEHYPGIISRAQIDYMLERGYSAATLVAEQRAGTRFVLAERDATAIGFAAVSPDPNAPDTVWLDKLYVRAEARGTGAGRRLIADAIAHAQGLGARQLRLRVNRHNAGAVAAYRAMGFEVETYDRKDIGHGYVMDDYLMALTLRVHGFG